MKREIEARLKELKAEYQKGQGQLTALEKETEIIRSSMLRISGAIQILEELIGDDKSTISNDGNTDLEMTKSNQKPA